MENVKADEFNDKTIGWLFSFIKPIEIGVK